jgi:predicted nucleic acid-binding protein
MTSWVVADSSIFIAVALREDHANRAAALIASWSDNKTTIAVPYLFRYELMSVTRKHVARGNITLQEGHEAMQAMLSHSVEVFMDEVLLLRGFEIASQFNRPAGYDSVYLALAERLNCEFWTADRKLINAVTLSLPWVKWIGDFALPESQR